MKFFYSLVKALSFEPICYLNVRLKCYESHSEVPQNRQRETPSPDSVGAIMKACRAFDPGSNPGPGVQY
jgi:hypothetical protein